MTTEELARRIRVFALQPDDIVDAVSGRLLITGFPEGGKVLRCQYDFMTDRIQFLVQHESFDECPAGVAPPVSLDVMYERLAEVPPARKFRRE